jgi:hypothetical protein
METTMMRPPPFFVPGCVSPADAEAEIAALATSAGMPVPVITERIFAVVFGHKDHTFAAEVGKQILPSSYFDEPNPVLAIFAGERSVTILIRQGVDPWTRQPTNSLRPIYAGREKLAKNGVVYFAEAYA